MTGSKTAGAAAKNKRRRWILTIATLVAIAFGVGGVRANRLVRHEQRFCTEECHAPKDGSALWHTTGHQDVECQSCHTSEAGTSFALLYKKTIGSKDLPKHGKPSVGSCTTCHERDPVDFRLVQATEGHRTHRGVKDVDCFSCHAKNAHNQAPQTEKLCLACHKEARLHKITAEAETCISCHQFSPGAKRAGKPRAMACGGCHSDPSKINATSTRLVNEEAVHGSLDCKLCHDPHGHKPKVAEGQPICARCHQIQLAQDAEKNPGPQGHKDCQGCHDPHAQHKHALDSCVKCHETRVKGIAPVVKGVTAQTALGVKSQTSALRHESCASCHLPHTWKADLQGCPTCHKDQAESIKTKSPAQHDKCEGCHDVHGPPPSGLVCLKCHGPQKQNHVATAPGRHKDCTSCHEPHSANGKAARDACAGCHLSAATQLVAEGAKGHATKGCIGCHTPHDNPKPSADLCSKCHTDKAKAVASAEQPKHRACVSCHQPHKFAIKDIAQACSTCHGQTVLASGGTHKGDCKDCHALHGPAQVKRDACWTCHAPVKASFKPPAGNEQHNKCRSCHTPHRPAAMAADKCGTCHTRQIQTAKTWPATSAHAGACQGCHTPHDVKAKKTCNECHAKEASLATGGKHQCAQCHAPHKQTPGAGAAWWGACNECHQKQVAGVKAQGPQHSQCKNCHQTHKFAIPTCQSCHSTMGDKGLHATKQHADKCSGCHDPHVKAEPSRAQCLACHTKQQNHEPTAQKCQACHPFR